jgi:hypothetical protein
MTGKLKWNEQSVHSREGIASAIYQAECESGSGCRETVRMTQERNASTSF